MSILLVVGAGGHGRVLADAAMSTDLWTGVCFIDDQVTQDVLGFPVIGRCSDLEQLRATYNAVAIGVGNARARLILLERCHTFGFELPIVIHRSAAVSRYARLGPGCVVFAQSAVNAGAVLARGCIVNTGATVDHDCDLDEGVHVCPGAHLAGNVRVGPRSWIGVGACVKQGIAIGADVTVGAGAAVVTDIGPELTVLGVPALPKLRRLGEN